MERLAEELPRKAVHVLAGCCALLLRWLTFGQAALFALAALLFNLFLVHGATRRVLLRRGERRAGFSWGIILYPTAVLALVLVFHSRLELVAAVWGLLAFGDGMAAVTGLLLRGPRLPWNPDKSWAGLAAFVLYGTAAAAFLLRWTQRSALEGGPSSLYVGDSFLTVGGEPVSAPLLLLLGCGLAAVAAGLAESARTGLDDNVVVPLVGGGVLYAASLVEPVRLAAAWPAVGEQLIPGAAINGVLAAALLAAGGADRSGAAWGWVLGTTLYAFAGWRGFLIVVVFVAMGTAATRLGFERKAALGLAQERSGRRGARHALANLTGGWVFGLLALATSHPRPLTVAMVAAFATATCDTVSSEVGQAYGRRHYLSVSFRRVEAGTGGAVSPIGTVSGWMAAVIVAGTGWGVGVIDPAGFGATAAGAVVGAASESVLEAVAGNRLGMSNEWLNALNTVIGGLVALGIYVSLT